MPRALKTAKDAEQVQRRVVETVSEMLLTIERDREAAVREYSRRLDGWEPASFVVEAGEIARAGAGVPDDLERHIEIALGHVRGFARAQRDTMGELSMEIAPGIVLGHRHVPVDRVGAYVPGGAYQMFASAFMTVAVAKVAGVPDVVATTPPYRGEGIRPVMLHAIAAAGADAVLSLGGVQGVATLAYGLFGLEPASMLVGAGNAYVAEAKRQLYGQVGIDLLAGPTEVLVVADDSVDPELAAIDLLSQAEHGPTSAAALVAVGEDVGQAVMSEVDRLLRTDWPTAELAGVAWRDYGSVLVVDSHEEALAAADELASEHLELLVAEQHLDWYHERLRNYGSLFVGQHACVSFGDKGVGTNHVLPTARSARYTGGLWVGRFLKTLTFQRLTADGAASVAPTIAAIAAAEGMLGHARSAEARLAPRTAVG